MRPRGRKYFAKAGAQRVKSSGLRVNITSIIGSGGLSSLRGLSTKGETMPSRSTVTLVQPQARWSRSNWASGRSSGITSLTMPRPGRANTALRPKLYCWKFCASRVFQVCGAGEAFR